MTRGKCGYMKKKVNLPVFSGGRAAAHSMLKGESRLHRTAISTEHPIIAPSWRGFF